MLKKLLALIVCLVFVATCGNSPRHRLIGLFDPDDGGLVISSPDELANLDFWFDNTSFYEDEAGTDPAEVNDQVLHVEDLSGNANHFSPGATGFNTLQTGGPNGFNRMNCTQSREMICDNAAAVGGDDFTIFFIGFFTQGKVHFGDFGASANWQAADIGNFTQFSITANSTTHTSHVSGGTTTGNHSLVLRWNGTAGAPYQDRWDVWIDSDKKTATKVVTASTYDGSTVSGNGANFNIGDNGAGQAGTYATEVFGYSAVLTDEQIEAVLAGYVNPKYGF